MRPCRRQVDMNIRKPTLKEFVVSATTIAADLVATVGRDAPSAYQDLDPSAARISGRDIIL